jgi:hypothetical protein
MNPTASLALMILAFLLPATASVILGWWLWRRKRKPVAIGGRRIRVTYYGLIASTVGFFLESTFLIREYAFSYRSADSIPLWGVVAWSAVLSWLLLAFVIASFLRCALFVGIMD